MKAQNFNKIFGVKRTIWNSDSYYVQDSDVQEQYKQDIMADYDCDEEDLTEERLAELWQEDNNINYEAERLQELAYLGKLDNADIMARTKSLYPYIAKIYGWPYRGSKKSA